MKKSKAEKKLEELTNSSISFYEKNDIDEFASDNEQLINWCSGHDNQEILMKDFDIDDCVILFYSSDNDERDINAWIVMCNNDVVAYGYSSD